MKLKTGKKIIIESEYQAGRDLKDQLVQTFLAKAHLSEWGREKTLGYASLLFHFVCPKMKAPFQKGKLKPLKGKDR